MNGGKGVFLGVARFGFRHWRAILAIVAVTAVISPAILRGLRIETASASFVASDDDVSRVYRDSLLRFGENDPLVIQILPVDGDQRATDSFTDRLAASVAAWPDIAWVEFRADGFLEGPRAVAMARAALLNSGADTTRKLTELLEQDAMRRQIRRTRKRIVLAENPVDRERLAADPLDIRSLLSPFVEARLGNLRFAGGSRYFDAPEGRSRLVFVQPRGSGEDTVYCVELIERMTVSVDQLRRSVPGAENLRCRFTGKHALTGESARVLQRDMLRISAAASILVLSLLFLVFRGWRAAVVCLVPILAALLPALIFARLCFNPLSFLAIGFAAIIVGLSVDVMLHCTARLFQTLSHGRLGLEAAVGRTLADCGPPVAVGVLTTAAAFLSLGFADYPALAQFGLLTASGLVISLIVSLCVFPAVVRWIVPDSGVATGDVRFISWTASVFSRCWDRPLLTVVASIGLVAAGVVVAGSFEFDNEFANLLPRRSAAVDVAREISQAYGAAFLLNTQLVVQADSHDRALAVQRTIDMRLEAMASEGRIAAFVSPTVLVTPIPPAGEQVMHLERAASLLNANRGAFVAGLEDAGFRHPARSLVGYANLQRVVAAPDDFAAHEWPRITADPLAKRLFSEDRDGVFYQTSVWPMDATADSGASRMIRATFEGLDVPDGAALHVTGTHRLYEHLHEVVASNLLRISLISGGLVIVVISAFFRRPGLVALGLVPILAAIPVTLAMVVATGISFSPLGIGITAIIMGIGIDDAVHILGRVRRDPAGDIRAVMREIGPVVSLTSLSSIVGFGALAFASHPVLSSLGMVVAFGIFACWVFSMATLPALYLVLERAPRSKAGASAALLPLVLVGATAVHGDDLDQVLRKVERNFDSVEAVSCRIDQVKQIQQLDGEVSFGGTLVFKKPHYLKMELAGDESFDVFCDGETIWLVDHDLEETETFRFDPTQSAGRLARLMPPVVWLGPDELRARFEMRTVETAEVATRLLLTPKGAVDSPVVELAVDLDRRGRIRRVRTLYSNGDVTTSEFSKWDRMKDVDESVFRYRPPVGVGDDPPR